MRGQILKGNDGDGVGIRVSGNGVKIAEGIQHLIIAIGRVGRKIANVAGKDIPLCIDVQLENREQFAGVGEWPNPSKRFHDWAETEPERQRR